MNNLVNISLPRQLFIESLVRLTGRADIRERLVDLDNGELQAFYFRTMDRACDEFDERRAAQVAADVQSHTT